MTQAKLKQLLQLLGEFKQLIGKEQPLAGQVISLIWRWVDDEIL
jgi:hypothetical protein